MQAHDRWGGKSIQGKMKPRAKQMIVAATTSLAEAAMVRTNLTKLLRKRQSPGPTTPRTGGQPITTLSDCAECWLTWKKRRSRKPSVLDRYMRALGLHILPRLGHLRLDELTTSDIEEFAWWCENARMDDGTIYTIPTVRGWWNVLTGLLSFARTRGYLNADLVDGVSPPEWQAAHRKRGRVREQRTLSKEQVAEMLDIVAAHHPRRYAEVVTIALTGGRIGELYALTWDKVDLERGALLLDESVWRGEVGTTKTGVGRVTVLPAHVIDTLTAHRESLRANHAVGWASGIVFPSTKGTHRTQASLTKVFKTVIREANHDVVVNCQVLRRSWNTLLRQADVHNNVIQAMMGHADDRMTKLYDGVPVDDKHEAVRRVAEGVRSPGAVKDH